MTSSCIQHGNTKRKNISSTDIFEFDDLKVTSGLKKKVSAFSSKITMDPQNSQVVNKNKMPN